MTEGMVIFMVCSITMIFAMFCLPGVGGGHIAPPPPPRKRNIVDQYGLPIVGSDVPMPPVKPPKPTGPKNIEFKSYPF